MCSTTQGGLLFTGSDVGVAQHANISLYGSIASVAAWGAKPSRRTHGYICYQCIIASRMHLACPDPEHSTLLPKVPCVCCPARLCLFPYAICMQQSEYGSLGSKTEPRMKKCMWCRCHVHPDIPSSLANSEHSTSFPRHQLSVCRSVVRTIRKTPASQPRQLRRDSCFSRCAHRFDRVSSSLSFAVAVNALPLQRLS